MDGAVDLDTLTDAELDAELVALVRQRHRLDAEIARRAAPLGRPRRCGSPTGPGPRGPACPAPPAWPPAPPSEILRRGHAVAAMPVTARGVGRRRDRHRPRRPARRRRRRRPRTSCSPATRAVLVGQCDELTYGQVGQGDAVLVSTRRRRTRPRRHPTTQARLAAAVTPGSTAPSPATSRWTRSPAPPSARRCGGSNATCTASDQRDGVIRTMSERMAAALVEMAVRSQTVPADGRRPEPLICILAGEATVEQLCELASGHRHPPRPDRTPPRPLARCRRSSSTAPTASSPPPAAHLPRHAAPGDPGARPALPTPLRLRCHRSPTATSTTVSPTPTAGSPTKPTATSMRSAQPQIRPPRPPTRRRHRSRPRTPPTRTPRPPTPPQAGRRTSATRRSLTHAVARRWPRRYRRSPSVKLATIRSEGAHRRGAHRRRRGGRASTPPTSASCCALTTGWRRRRLPTALAGPSAGLDYAPLVPNPDKIICVGLNYRSHILEMGRELPGAPDAVRQVPRGADRRQRRHRAARRLGRGRLGGRAGRHHRRSGPPRLGRTRRRGCIAGYAVLNDVSVRDCQNRTLQWLQGKTFEATTPLGPWLVTADEARRARAGRSRARSTASRCRRPTPPTSCSTRPTLVSYISTIITLEPGDVIATGTPGGVGAGPHAAALPRRRVDGRHPHRRRRRAAQPLPQGASSLTVS